MRLIVHALVNVCVAYYVIQLIRFFVFEEYTFWQLPQYPTIYKSFAENEVNVIIRLDEEIAVYDINGERRKKHHCCAYIF